MSVISWKRNSGVGIDQTLGFELPSLKRFANTKASCIPCFLHYHLRLSFLLFQYQSAQMEYQTKKARFSLCKEYRYTLERSWSTGTGAVLFIGLNPSTADCRKDDPTIRRCVKFAVDWGFNKLIVTNIFAYRTTYPEDLKQKQEPVGSQNDVWIKRSYGAAQLAVACWGDHGSYLNRGTQIKEYFPRLYFLKMNRSEQPAHPLYLRATVTPQLWR